MNEEPFKFGCIVENEHSCPRPELEKDLRRYVSGGQNLVLQGERRRGKSSLVVKVVKDIRGMGLLYVDLLGISSTADFCRRVMDGIVGLDSSRSFLRKTVLNSWRWQAFTMPHRLRRHFRVLWRLDMCIIWGMSINS